MKNTAKFFYLILLTTLSVESLAQSTKGITNKPDTSYTNYSAYISALKTYPNIKLVNEFYFTSVREKKDIVYCTIGGRTLKLDVFYPNKKVKQAGTAIIIIHGGGWRTGNRTQHYPLAQQLANLGYVCFTPEYRLSTEALYPAAVYDIKASIRWAHENAKEYSVDTSKIVVLGFSAGGELAAFIGATNTINKFEGNNNCQPESSSFVHAVIDMDGILAFIHPESGEGDDSKRISAATNWFGYSKTENAALWQEGSPLTHVTKNSPPILFINSGVDRMHAGRTDYINKLKEHNIYSEVKKFEGAPHSFCLFEPWFQPTVKYIDDFLKKMFTKK
jgi:pectinesterase